MSEESADVIQQGSRVYRYACTEEVEIGGNIWMRDRYNNVNTSTSFLLVNFVDTGIPVNKRAKAKPDRKPDTNYGANIRRYIRDLERKERSGE
jgi:hypothetical protein